MSAPRVRESLRRIDYTLLAVLTLMGLLPTVYTTVRVRFLGDLPVDWGYNIASQLAWLNVTFEVVHEAIMLPMFFLIGRFLAEPKRFASAVSNGLLLIGALYGPLTIVTVLFARPMIVFMGPEDRARGGDHRLHPPGGGGADAGDVRPVHDSRAGSTQA